MCAEQEIKLMQKLAGKKIGKVLYVLELAETHIASKLIAESAVKARTIEIGTNHLGER